MLSDRNIREINNQIASALRESTSWSNSHEEKMEALERVAKLKTLLYPQPTQQEIVEQLANALRNTQPCQSHQPKTIVEILADALCR